MKRLGCCALLLALLCGVFGTVPARAQAKRLVVVPASGPLAGRQVYANSYAVLIGINDYPNLPPSLSLSYAVKDATDLRDVLIQSYGFPAEHMTLLTNAQATRRNIEDAINALTDSSKVKPEDRVLIFFSGHGQTVSQTLGGETGFLIPEDVHDLDLSHPDNIGPYNRSCLSMTWLRDTMQSSPAKHVLLLADACYSGLLARSKGIESLNPEVVAEDMALPARQVITAGRRGETSEELRSTDTGPSPTNCWNNCGRGRLAPA